MGEGERKPYILVFLTLPDSLLWSDISCPCDCASIYLQPCCCGCCLYGIWCIYGIPIPAISCVTACLCLRDTRYVTEKAGIETGELLVVDEKTETLGFYSATSEEMQCFCTKKR